MEPEDVDSGITDEFSSYAKALVEGQRVTGYIP